MPDVSLPRVNVPVPSLPESRVYGPTAIVGRVAGEPEDETGRFALPGCVAVIATGVIGRSWLRVFARAGCLTRAWDPNPDVLAAALAWCGEKSEPMSSRDANGVASCPGQVIACRTLAEAVAGADYIQENGPETLDVKRALFRDLDRHAALGAIIASSTSAIDMTAIAEGVSGAARCVIAHPVNPPHVLPVVEVLGGRETDRAVVKAAVRVMRAVGQRPVVLNYFVPGFLLNRMQVALLQEAISLLERGVADVEAIDAVISDGLGLRWALMGPFGVANSNADGGIREYLRRYAATLQTLMDDLERAPTVGDAVIERIGQQTDAMERGAGRDMVQQWRDRLVRKLLQVKRDDPHPGREGGARPLVV
jgi:L-gulonate 3-dehydrogenase